MMENLEEILQELPEVIADKLQAWRMTTLNREKTDAVLYLKFKGAETKRTADEIKAMVKESAEHYQASIDEIKAESEYNLVYERLLSAKKRASLRTAF